MSLDELREIMTDPDTLMEFAVRMCADANGIDPSTIRGAIVTFNAPDRKHPELMHTYVLAPVSAPAVERLRVLQEAVAQVEEEIRVRDEQIH
ncbi:hypothetical protein [Saccharopolyspora taberi]|uniref:Uncharacterized protein n=1 Tax=Saccharopolyspora taberi TaxID=60895 RepID=A0ABN3V4A7_9PSEU